MARHILSMHCTDWEQAVGLQGPKPVTYPFKPCWQVQGLGADCAEEDAGPVCQALKLRRQATILTFQPQVLNLQGKVMPKVSNQ